jgi:hypothetical protein
MKLQWLPEGGGFYAEASNRWIFNGWIFSISCIIGPVDLSYHQGDGDWIPLGRYGSPAEAAKAADDFLVRRRPATP